MNSVPTSILENVYEYSARKFMRELLWIECQQVYDWTVIHRLPTSIWGNGYEYSANKDKGWWLLKQFQHGYEVMVMRSYSASKDLESTGVL